MYNDYTQHMQQFFSNIANLCHIYHISIGELEDSIHASRGYFARLKRNFSHINYDNSDKKLYPDLNILMRICSCYNVSLDMLFASNLNILEEQDEIIFNFILRIRNDLRKRKIKIDKEVHSLPAMLNTPGMDNGRYTAQTSVNNYVELQLIDKSIVRIYQLENQYSTFLELALKIDKSTDYQYLYDSYTNDVTKINNYLQLLVEEAEIHRNSKLNSETIGTICRYIEMDPYYKKYDPAFHEMISNHIKDELP